VHEAGEIRVKVRVRASGRVNLIGDHTDYMGGLAMPMAIDRSIVIEGDRTGGRVQLVSDSEPDPASFELPVSDPASLRPDWARYPGAVAAELGADQGFVGTVSSDVPPGAGLSSSAALEVAAALALGADKPEGPEEALALAKLCQRAEHRAVGVRSGLMDQLSICAGRTDHATLIDFVASDVEHVPVPARARVWVVHSGQQRRLDSSSYAERRRCAEAAADQVGPLPEADLSEIEALRDPLMARRARHVRTECDRVRRFADCLASGDLTGAGAEMVSSHASLRDDYEVSTPGLDELVQRLCTTAGVYGARLTGAGFGGCAVALTSPDFELSDIGGQWEGWEVRPTDGTDVLQ
jgi:galactokinase